MIPLPPQQVGWRVVTSELLKEIKPRRRSSQLWGSSSKKSPIQAEAT